MQTPVLAIKTSGDRSTSLWGVPFLNATAVSPFLPGKFDKSDNLEKNNLP
jgi:hypothetical protein